MWWVGSLVLPGECRPVGDDRAANRRERPAPAAQKPADKAGDQVNEDGAEAENRYDNPPSPGRETVHVVNILAAESRQCCAAGGARIVSMPWQTRAMRASVSESLSCHG